MYSWTAYTRLDSFFLLQAFTQANNPAVSTSIQPSVGKMRRTVVTRIVEAAKAIALCHNVTPIHESNQLVEKKKF